MKLKCLVRGGVGYRGDNRIKNQTWCNVAVFLTIRAVDDNYIKFVIDSSEYPWWQERYKNQEPWKKYENEYKNGYRPSNFWCDVLNYKANVDLNSPIEEVDYLEAQKLAKQGIVVIAAWKNPKKTKDSSPHYVTLSPNNCINKLENILVANVGLKNGYIKLFNAFPDSHYKEVKFYYNRNQIYISNFDAGKGKWFPSINELTEKYGEI